MYQKSSPLDHQQTFKLALSSSSESSPLSIPFPALVPAGSLELLSRRRARASVLLPAKPVPSDAKNLLSANTFPLFDERGFIADTSGCLRGGIELMGVTAGGGIEDMVAMVMGVAIVTGVAEGMEEGVR